MEDRPDNKVSEMRVELNWQSYNTGLFTNKLYRHVQRGEFDHSIEAKPGSLVTTFLIGVSSALTVEIIKELSIYIARRHRNELRRRRVELKKRREWEMSEEELNSWEEDLKRREENLESYEELEVGPPEITINGDNTEINIILESENDLSKLMDEIETMEDDD